MMRPFSSPSLCGLLVAFLIPLVPGVASAAGLAAFKQQSYHNDSAAEIIAYSKFISDQSSPFVKLMRNQAEITKNKVNFVARIDFPEGLPEMITSDNEMAPVKAFLKELQEFSLRFPKSETLLAPHIQSYQGYVNKYDGGEVRYYGSWISGEAFAQIGQVRRKEKEAMLAEKKAEEERIAKKEEEIAANREKGLELYQGEWLPAEEVAALERKDDAGREAWKLLEQKSVEDASIEVFQIFEEGMLVKLLDGSSKQKGLNTNILMLYGADKRMAAEGDRYQVHLYWCGTYQYLNLNDMMRTVNAYCLDYPTAWGRIRDTLLNEKSLEHFK